MGDRKLETVAREVFLSIPPDVRTGVFIDVFTPCDWHHAARCMVDYAGILDDPREPFAPACDMPVIVFGLRRPRPLGRGGSKPSSFHRLI